MKKLPRVVLILPLFLGIHSAFSMEERPSSNEMATLKLVPEKRKISEITEPAQSPLPTKRIKKTPIFTRRIKKTPKVASLFSLRELAKLAFIKAAPSIENLSEILEDLKKLEFKDNKKNNKNATQTQHIDITQTQKTDFMHIADELKERIRSYFPSERLSYDETRLHNAQSPKEIDRLLSFSIDPNIKDRSQRTALNALLEKGYLEAAYRLLELKGTNLDVSSPDEFNETPLQKAIKHQDLQIINFIYAILRAQNNKKPEALHASIFCQNLCHESAVTLAEKYEQTILRKFVINAQSKEDIEGFVSLGIDCRIVDVSTNQTLLNRLIAHDNLEAALRLLELKGEEIDIISPDKHGITPLHRAIQANNSQIVHKIYDILLQKFRNNNQYLKLINFALTTPNKYGQNSFSLAIQYMPEFAKTIMHNVIFSAQHLNCKPFPLLIACQHNPSLVPLLLEQGADLHIRDEQGNTALCYVAPCKTLNAEEAQLIDIILNAGIDIDAQNNAGFTALISASLFTNDTMIKILLDKGANPTIHDKDGFTPLMHYLEGDGRNVQTVAHFLEKGCNPNAKASNSETLLRMTTNCEIMKLILDRGADCNATNDQGDTPLMHAATLWAKDAVALLLARGANPNAQNKNGQSALSCALEESSEIDDEESLEELKQVILSLLQAGSNVTEADIQAAHNLPNIQQLLKEYFEKNKTQNN